MNLIHRTNKKELEQQVILGVRELGISMVLFRHAIGVTLGLSVTDMECLGVLFFKNISTPTELARHTGLSSGATTSMLDRLERSGLVERRPNPHDRRGTQIVIVKKAAKKIAPLFASGRKAQDELVASYSESELELLVGFFERSVNMGERERKRLHDQKVRR